MNTRLKSILPVVLSAVVLAACGSTSTAKPAAAKPAAAKPAAANTAPTATAQPQTVKVDSIDSRREVMYRCGAQGKDALSVMYGIKGGEAVVAQVKYKGQLTENLFRIVGADKQNAFWGGNVAWMVPLAKADDLGKVKGGVLSIREAGGGNANASDRVVTGQCVPVKSSKR